MARVLFNLMLVDPKNFLHIYLKCFSRLDNREMGNHEVAD